ncbi:protein of unknown function [Burkholderia multivorans]
MMPMDGSGGVCISPFQPVRCMSIQCDRTRSCCWFNDTGRPYRYPVADAIGGVSIFSVQLATPRIIDVAVSKRRNERISGDMTFESRYCRRRTDVFCITDVRRKSTPVDIPLV